MSKAIQIALLNDTLRESLGGVQEDLGRVVVTSGIMALTQDERGHILTLVRKFDDFSSDNDPHGEHDFGKVVHDGIECFWKIDYYNLAMDAGSEDAADPAITERVLTIMRVSEY